MKAENIYVDITESVSEVVEKIINSKNDTIVLIIPANAKIADSLLNFKLIKREAAAADKKLFVNSDAEEVVFMAKEAGMKLIEMAEISRPKPKTKILLGDIKPPKRKKIEKAQKTISPQQTEEELPEIKEIIQQVEIKTQRKKVQKDITPKNINNEKKFFTDYFDEDHFSNIEIDEKEIKKEKIQKPKLKIKKGVKILLTAIILFGLATFCLIYFIAKAEVRIFSNKYSWSEQIPVLATAGINDIDQVNFKVPIKSFDFSRTITEKFPATEVKSIQAKARGTIRIYNAYSSEPQILVATTRFLSKEGKLFRLVNKTTVPGAKIQDGKIVPSYIDAEVIADQPGESYNIGPTTFTIPGFEGTPRYSKFYAESSSSMTGGYIGTTKVVGQSDINQAKNKLVEIASISLNEELNSKLSANDIVLPDAKHISIASFSTNPKLDEKAEQFEVTAKIFMRALVFNEDDVKRLFINEAKDNNSQLLDKELFSYQLNYGAARFDFEKKLLSFPVTANLIFCDKIDQREFSSNLAGKNIKDLELFLKQYKSINKVEIKIWPKFLNFTPLNSNRITIIIDEKAI
ncbi:MAG: hypothetical protein N2692_03010 [Patescibacteria group bacterium]|jgi:hypothetical protein|nr:hypothetical protein [Patescibacteria group bacterium]